MIDTKLAKFKEDALYISILFILPILYLKGVLFFTGNILGSPYTDIRGEAYAKLFGYRDLLNFSIPLWNPYAFGGMPFVASPGSAFFYPFNLICAFLPINYAINWDIALHLFLSEIFTYYFIRNYGVGRFGSMMAGIIYAFSAPQVMHIYAGHLIAMTSLPWTPLLFLFLDKFARSFDLKYGICLSFAIAFQLLAGYTQYLFYSMIAVSLYFLLIMMNIYLNGRVWAEIWKRSLFFTFFVFFGVLISAVQILPTLEIMKYSTRQSLSYEWVSTFSFPPGNFITFLIPDFFGNMINIPYWGKNNLWEMTAYTGILPLLLAIIAVFYARRRAVWFFAGLTILSGILAMGKYTPLLKILYYYVPGFNLFRGNSKFIFLTALSISVLAGFGIDVLLKGLNNIKRFRLSISGAGTFAAIALSAMYIHFDGSWFKQIVYKVVSPPDMYVDLTQFLQGGFEYGVMTSFRNGIAYSALLLISGMTVLLLYSYQKIEKRVVMFAVFGIVVFDLFTFGIRYMIAFDIRKTYMDSDVQSFLKKDKGPFRMLAPELNPNIGMPSGVETLNGYGNMMIMRYGEFINLSQGDPVDELDLFLSVTKVSKLVSLLNVKYIVLSSTSNLNDLLFEKIFDNGKYKIYRNINAFPRAFIVHEARIINGRDSIFRELASPEFNPAISAIVEEGVDGWINNPTAKSPLPKFTSYSSNKIAIDAFLTKPGFLVLGDVWYPGWKAFVDGKETKIYRTNYVMRGVVLPEGRHKVEFSYDPISFKIGALISLASIILAMVFLSWDWRRSEKSKGPV